METISAVCRTCLQSIEDDCPRFDLNFLESNQNLMPVGLKLGACFPDLNLYITSNPVLCNDCFSAVKFVYKFREKCLKTEGRIEKYLEENNSLTFVDLQEVVTVTDQQKVNVTSDMVDEKKCSIIVGQTTKQLNKMICNDSVTLNTAVDKYIVTLTEQFKPDSFKNEEKHFDLFKTDQSSIKTEKNTIKVQKQATPKTKCNATRETDKPYKCAECRHCTTTKGNLKTHIAIHNGYKPYKCTDCNYTSLQKQHLVVHMRRHTGEKPYKCTECQYSCRQPTNLNAHMNNHLFK